MDVFSEIINVLDIFDICSNLPNKSEGYILVGKVFNKVVEILPSIVESKHYGKFIEGIKNK